MHLLRRTTDMLSTTENGSWQKKSSCSLERTKKESVIDSFFGKTSVLFKI